MDRCLFLSYWSKSPQHNDVRVMIDREVGFEGRAYAQTGSRERKLVMCGHRLGVLFSTLEPGDQHFESRREVLCESNFRNYTPDAYQLPA